MSSKIRNEIDLKDAMDEEFAWRKVELSALKTLVEKAQTIHTKNLTIRAAITLLYAHWEGFIKHIGTLYVQFVSEMQLKHNELANHFFAISISSLVHDVGMTTNKIQPSLKLTAFIREADNSRSNIVWRSTVQTESNLSSNVFQEIILTLGLDYSRFATKEKLLDERLLKNRNNIAHGKHLVINLAEYLELHDEILGMMQDFFDQVENAVELKSFMRK